MRSLSFKFFLVTPVAFLLTSVLFITHRFLPHRMQGTAAQEQCRTMQFPAVPAPVAPRKTPVMQHPNSFANGSISEHLSDPYTWLRDDSRSNPEVLSYLSAENSYAQAALVPLQGLVAELTADMDGRSPDVEVSVPRLCGGYIYYDVRGPGDDYWSTYRTPLLPAGAGAAGGFGSSSSSSLAAAVAGAVAAVQQQAAGQQQQQQQQQHAGTSSSSSGNAVHNPPQLVLDQNRLSAGHAYWDVLSHVVSPDGSRVAFLFDTVGGEEFSLQVLDIATGAPLLPQPLTGCGEVLLWWGASSDSLAYSTLAGDHNTELRLLRLTHQQQQQQQQVSLLYSPEDGERGLDLQLTTDRQFVILSSSVEGDTKVAALPTSTPLAFNSSSSSTVDIGLPLAVPAAAWWRLVMPAFGLDVLACDHLPNSSSNSSSGMFVALVDSDDAPDGEVVLIHASAPGSSHRAAQPFMDVLVSNHSTGGDFSSSGSMSDSDSDADTTFYHHGAAVAAEQQYQQQQEDDEGWTWGVGRLPALEIRSVKLHPSGSHLAVGVRRQGVCAVDIYTLPPPPGAAAAAAVSTAMSTTSSERLGLQQEGPYVVTLRTAANSSSSAAASRPAAAAAAAATASAAATAGLSTARLSWVLALEDPTLVLDVIGVVTPQSQQQGLHPSAAAAAAAAAADSWLVVSVSGITSPTAVFYVNLTDPQQQVKVYQEVVRGFTPSAYTAQLEWALSADGTRVPLTVAHRPETLQRDGSNVAILHAYGAYGSSQWPSFNPADLALLDRGVVLVICHARGGGELGSHWHTSAKKLHKKRTFQDLLACASHLTAAGYTRPGRLGLWGRSAGGLTLGASLNMHPGVAAAAVLDVPFLDVLGDMSDPGLPLTIKERGEWGDPLESKVTRDYIASYSPLHNLDPTRVADYPALLLTASLHDTRVNFWEPAKYVATLRHLHQQQQQQLSSPGSGHSSSNNTAADRDVTGDKPLLLVTDLQAGHFAASAASSRLQERATKVAFLLANLWQGCRE